MSTNSRSASSPGATSAVTWSSDGKIDGLPVNWDGKDWRTYKWRMESVFEEHDMWGVVTGATTADQLGEAVFTKMQKKIRRIIGQTLPPERLQLVADLKTGTEMWAALCELYEKKQQAGARALMKQRLLEELNSLKYKEGTDIDLHLAKMFNLRKELKDYSHEVQDLDMVNLMFGSLPNVAAYSQLRSVVTVVANTTPEGVQALISEQVFREESSRRSKPAQQSRPDDKKPKGKTHSNKKNPMKGGKVLTCRNCNSEYHFARDCPEPKRQVNRTTRSVDDASVPGENDDLPGHAAVRGGEDLWYIDCATNTHVVNKRSYFLKLTEVADDSSRIRVGGLTDKMSTQAMGIGTACFQTIVDGVPRQVILDNVLFIPNAKYCLLSPGVARMSGYGLRLDEVTAEYRLTLDGVTVLQTPVADDGQWPFRASPVNLSAPPAEPVVNFTARDGVATMQEWHDRLGHTCRQYLVAMVDQGLVQGMLMTHRTLKPCDCCHIGKQRRKNRMQSMDRGITAPNQLVIADLLIAPRNNGTGYVAILVIMDMYSKFITIHLLRSKSSTVVNPLIQQYVMWAERQAGRAVEKIIQREFEVGAAQYPVQRVLTDKGGEFVNNAMATWYASRGIQHIKVGPKSSHLNPCERAHQSLVQMSKAMMHGAGFPRSFWPHALQHAVYIKNRVYTKGNGAIPYERMFGVRPDIHHLRKFGSLAYVHVPKAPDRPKHDDNTKVGFVLGYSDDEVGCKVYVPADRTIRFAVDLRIEESIVYRDRHEVRDEDRDIGKWFHFTRRDEDADTDDGDEALEMSDDEMSSAPSRRAGTPDVEDGESLTTTLVLEEGDDEDSDSDGEVDADDVTIQSTMGDRASSMDDSSVTTTIDLAQSDHDSESSVVDSSSDEPPSGASDSPDEDDDVASGNIGDDDDEFGDWDPGRGFADAESDGTESVIGNQGSVSDTASEPETDAGEAPGAAILGDRVTGKRTQRDATPSEEGLHAGVKLQRPLDPTTGKRAERDQTPSEEALALGDKRLRTGLRDRALIKPPNRYNDFVVNVTRTRVVDRMGKPIKASEVKMPRSVREAMRSKFADFWKAAQDREMEALRAKGVLEEISRSSMPTTSIAIRTMWVWALKSDQQGFVTEFKARLVILGNDQRPGIDFTDTFAPVARMSSFRTLLALAATMGLKVYGGDVNTAYLNATLKIPQYADGVPGYPCSSTNNVYVVRKALYGLRQSGREWNEELNSWMLARGFSRCSTEPCLYFIHKDGVRALVLVYVDDVVCATNDESFKCKLFEDLDSSYGFKDQGELDGFLGIEVVQSAASIIIHQRKFAQHIVDVYGYTNAHGVGNPMEVTQRLQVASDGDAVDSSFDYRGAVGKLMYLATGTRPDLAYAVGQLSRFVSKPTAKHVGALKRVLRYLVSTMDKGIEYTRSRSGDGDAIEVQGYCDSDWAGDLDSRKSTTGFVFMMAGGAISWMSRRQTVIALSTAEAEYVAGCEATMEAKALWNTIGEVLPRAKLKIGVGIDNAAAIVMATNPTFSRRTRHIELRWHFIRSQVELGVVVLFKVDGVVNPADAFTKPLDKDRLAKLTALMGMTRAQ